MSDVVVFGAIVLVLAVGGVVLGMLLVPRLERLTEPPPDEDTGAGDDPASD